LVGSFSSGGRAQPGWVQQVSGTTQAIQDLCFISNNEAWAVGNTGTILHTADAGEYWIPQSSPTSLNLIGVYFINNLTGWAVGDQGIVIKTTDGGFTWFESANSVTYTLNDVVFYDEFFGLACGGDGLYGKVYSTTDGGYSWIEQVMPGFPESFFSLSFVNSTTGWVAGLSGIYYTNDAGANWTNQPEPSGYDLGRIFMLDINTGWAAGQNGTILFTANGGSTWTIQPCGTTQYLCDIYFLNSQLGVACGYNGTVLFTDNGGLSWNSVPGFSISQTFRAIELTDSYICFMGGEGGVIFRTEAEQNDLIIYAYQGLDSICANIVSDVIITVHNNGPGPIEAADFVILDGADILLTYHWNGLLTAGQFEDINLGQLALSHSGTYTGVVSGDSATTNNISFKEISVFPYTGSTSGTHNICAGDSVNIFADGGLSYYWMNAGPDTLNANQTVNPIQNKNYFVSIETEYCAVMDSVQVIVGGADCGQAYSAISPNGDGINDYLFISGIVGSDNTVHIYDRWGDIVISYTNYDNETVAWTGYNYLGETLAAGTYFYTYEAPLLGIKNSSWVQIVK